MAERYGYETQRALILGTLAQLDWLTGKWDRLAELVTPLADDAPLRPVIRINANLVLGLLHAAMGNRGEAEHRLLTWLSEVRESGTNDQFAEPAAALARLWTADGRAEEALHITEEPVEIAVGKGIWVHGGEVVPARVDLLVTIGRADEARDLTAAYAHLVDGKDAPAAQAALATCEAMLATDPRQAAVAFGRAARAWQGLPRPYDTLLARERQAECLLAAGRADDGCELLTGAWRGLVELGARGDADRVRNRLNKRGVDAAGRSGRGRPGYGNELSPREIDVVRLVVEGLTNRQIADALVVSRQTVNSHVRSAMRKLHVSSRTALAVSATKLGVGGDDRMRRRDE